MKFHLIFNLWTASFYVFASSIDVIINQTQTGGLQHKRVIEDNNLQLNDPH